MDLDAAARYCGQAERKLKASPAIALAAAEQAIALLAAGVALADEPYATWVDSARGQLRNLARRARLAAAEAALATDDARTAIRHAEAATAADPLDEAAHRWYMSACASAASRRGHWRPTRRCATGWPMSWARTRRPRPGSCTSPCCDSIRPSYPARPTRPDRLGQPGRPWWGGR